MKSVAKIKFRLALLGFFHFWFWCIDKCLSSDPETGVTFNTIQIQTRLQPDRKAICRLMYNLKELLLLHLVFQTLRSVIRVHLRPLLLCLWLGGERRRGRKEGEEEKEGKKGQHFKLSWLLAGAHHYENIQVDTFRVGYLETLTRPPFLCESTAA